jgi:uncharacterized protein DUF4440
VSWRIRDAVLCVAAHFDVRWTHVARAAGEFAGQIICCNFYPVAVGAIGMEGEGDFLAITKADDRDGFLTLWDERFVGWPRRASIPVDKNKMREDLKRAPDRKVIDYKLEPLSVREYGGSVVITLYRATVHSTDNNGKDERTRSYRLTHTWMKTQQAWQIIGGMSSADSSN